MDAQLPLSVVIALGHAAGTGACDALKLQVGCGAAASRRI